MRRLFRQWRPGVAAAVSVCGWLSAAAPSADADAQAAAASAPATNIPSRSDEPRAFGWRVGDIVRRNVSIEAPAGWTLDAASLPPLGRHGTALELRAMRQSSHRHLDGSHRIDLRLDYQIFIAPKEVRTFELPELRVGFTGKPGGAQARVGAWPVIVSPLTATDAESRDGLGEFRPEANVPRIGATASRRRLGLWTLGIVLGAVYLLHVYVGLPWTRSRRRPFAAAWRTVQLASASDASTAMADAYRAIHGALNQAGGGVLFAHGVDPFITASPAYGALRSDLLAFFERSRAVFFAATPAIDRSEHMRWLQAFARRLRNAERGSA